MTGAAESVQEKYLPEHVCFGCGPANPDGLLLRSHLEGDELVAEWCAGPGHQAFPGMVAGGILGTLLDCHSNWRAALHLMGARGLDRPPITVTAEYHVKLEKPTPSDRPLRLRAWVVEGSARKAVVEAEVTSGGVRTATCSGTFVAVRKEHLANAWR